MVLNNGMITISSNGSSEVVRLSAFKPDMSMSEVNGCFVESRGCVSIEAENYSAKTDKNGAGWREITTLGTTGDTITVLPFMGKSFENNAELLAGSPVLEYDIYLWEPGDKKVTVRAIPTHAVTTENELRYAVAFDDQEPVWVGYDTLEWSSQWNLNVLQGTAISESSHNIDKAGKHKLKVWMVDPGLVLDKIIIGNYTVSHLGPPETIVSN